MGDDDLPPLHQSTHRAHHDPAPLHPFRNRRGTRSRSKFPSGRHARALPVRLQCGHLPRRRQREGRLHALPFGYDPAGDYHRIVNDLAGRRVNTAAPERSLLLLKAIGAVPHTGGELFESQEPYYRTLRDWIAAGAPDDSANIPDTIGLELTEDRFVFEGKTTTANLKVIAHNSDGSKRDVTGLAIYHSNNPSVATIDENGRIGGAAAGTLTSSPASAALRSPPASPCCNPTTSSGRIRWRTTTSTGTSSTGSKVADRAVGTVRRRNLPAPASPLDLAARPPTPGEYQVFMSDTGADKRLRKIDELLADDAFADLWTTLWAEQLRLMGETIPRTQPTSKWPTASTNGSAARCATVVRSTNLCRR